MTTPSPTTSSPAPGQEETSSNRRGRARATQDKQADSESPARLPPAKLRFSELLETVEQLSKVQPTLVNSAPRGFKYLMRLAVSGLSVLLLFWGWVTLALETLVSAFQGMASILKYPAAVAIAGYFLMPFADRFTQERSSSPPSTPVQPQNVIRAQGSTYGQLPASDKNTPVKTQGKPALPFNPTPVALPPVRDA